MEGKNEGTMEMDNRLPSRLFATDRYPNVRLNVYSRPDLISYVCEILRGTPEFSVVMKSAFGRLFELPVFQCALSCKLIYALMARQLVTKKKYVLWTVFGGQPLWFSLVEFDLVTRLCCDEFPEDYEYDYQPTVDMGESSFWHKLIGHDPKTTLGDIVGMLFDPARMPGWRRLRLALIILVDGVLIVNHQTHKKTPKYVAMLEDIEHFLNFPWGRESFMCTLASMKPSRRSGGVASFQKQMQQQTMKINGFPLALQLLAYETNNVLLKKSDLTSILEKPFVGG